MKAKRNAQIQIMFPSFVLSNVLFAVLSVFLSAIMPIILQELSRMGRSVFVTGKIIINNPSPLLQMFFFCFRFFSNPRMFFLNFLLPFSLFPFFLFSSFSFPSSLFPFFFFSQFSRFEFHFTSEETAPKGASTEGSS